MSGDDERALVERLTNKGTLGREGASSVKRDSRSRLWGARQAATDRKGRTLDTDPDMVLRQYRRAKDKAAAYRQGKATPGDVQAAWDRYWWLCYKAPTDTVIAERNGPPPPLMVLPIDGKRYSVSGVHQDANGRLVAGPSREHARLLDVWTRYYVGQPIRRHDPSKFRHVGLLHEFGHLFDPPVDGKPAALARRFKISETRIRSRLRRYRRLTVKRSVSKA